MSLDIKKLYISVEGEEIVKGCSLEIQSGEVHVIMGPNGSGKSTLANTLMGHPKYDVTSGSIMLDGRDITEEAADERAKAGLFLSMQYPPAIAGVTVSNFLRVAVESLTGEKQSPVDFYRMLQEKMEQLNIDPSFAKRHVNQGFSGGEKKKAEILQLSVLDPKYAILDETDSGLDVDALKIVAHGISSFKGNDKGILLITHYNRILEFIEPDYVHVMVDGNIVHSGGKALAADIENKGYEAFV